MNKTELNIAVKETPVSLNLDTPELRQELGLKTDIVVQKVNDAPVYDGEYSVIPKTEMQTLNTIAKVMEHDVTIFAIPYFEATNTSGGETVYIGSEV